MQSLYQATSDTYDYDTGRGPERFDAIVVGGRIAGAATAFQLAWRGWRVALIERAARPLGRVLSLPLTHPRGLVRFEQLGLMPALQPILPQLRQLRTFRMPLDSMTTIEGRFPAFADWDHSLILLRELVDDALLDYVLTSTQDRITLIHGTVTDLCVEANGAVSGVHVQYAPSASDQTRGIDNIELHAPLTIGADGRFSKVARLLEHRHMTHRYAIRPAYTTVYYLYCDGIEDEGLADVTFFRGQHHQMLIAGKLRAATAELAPGESGQVIGVFFPKDQFPAFQAHPLQTIQQAWEGVPELHKRMRAVRFHSKGVMGLSPIGAEGYFRTAGGAGWALVGDARHFKDPASGQGIHDALFSVQQLLSALDEITSGMRLSYKEARTEWPHAAHTMQQRSDRALRPMYDFTYQFAESMTRSPTALERALLASVANYPWATEQFLGILTGRTNVTTFNRWVAPRLLMLGLAGQLRERVAIST